MDSPAPAPLDPQVSDLLGALAAGVRAVNALPTGDEYDFCKAFAEFSQHAGAAQGALLETLQEALQALPSLDDTDNKEPPTDLDDPALWDDVADACEALVEQVEASLKDTSAVDQLHQWSDQARQRSQHGRAAVLAGLVDMEKPQVTHQILANNNNDRTQPFCPRITTKHYAIQPLDLSFRPGPGLTTRTGQARVVPDSMVIPTTHVGHPYQAEIEALVFPPDQFPASKPLTALISKQDTLQATWVDTPSALDDMVQQLQGVQEVALDLEAHSYRSFAGLVCLMQISIRTDSHGMQNYLVDTLKLHSHLHDALAPLLANPAVTKVMHGADSDVAWLQRDFGLYIVHLFDTGRAARALRFSSAGYAYLLHRYVGIAADKSFQLADWRQRPLPAAMQQYAIQDTHYLLDIYERLKYELQQSNTTSMQDAWQASQQVTLIRYTGGEPFDPKGYKKLLHRRRGGSRGKSSTTVLTPRQEGVLCDLWDWRDATARRLDESLDFVCPDASLVRLALASPTTTLALSALFQPVPPVVWERASDLMDLIKRHKDLQPSSSRLSPDDDDHDHHKGADSDEEDEDEDDEEEDDDELEDDEVARQRPVGTPSSAFFKPASAETSNVQQEQQQQQQQQQRRGMMSPVLGTEALYKQAGWMTPQEKQQQHAVDPVSTEEDDGHPEEEEDGAGKPKRLLSVHPDNQDYRSTRQFADSLEFKARPGQQLLQRAEGLGTSRAAREHSQSPPTLDEETKLAKQRSARIKNSFSRKQVIPAVLNMISTSNEAEDDDAGDEGDVDRDHARSNAEEEDVEDDDELVIPRSMREIYKISNRNRRFKKAGSPTPERGATPTNEKEREELARAEALIRDRGLAVTGLFDDASSSTTAATAGGSPGKRPRTKSTGRESEDTVPADGNVASKEDDLAFMKEVGWIDSKDDFDKIMGQRYGRTSAEGSTYEGEETQESGSNTKEAQRQAAPFGFDYSQVGPIGIVNTQQQQQQQQQSSNPFFAGAAMTGGPLAQNFSRQDQRPRKSGSQGGKGKQGRKQQERLEKKDGTRSFAYRSRR